MNMVVVNRTMSGLLSAVSEAANIIHDVLGAYPPRAPAYSTGSMPLPVPSVPSIPLVIYPSGPSQTVVINNGAAATPKAKPESDDEDETKPKSKVAENVATGLAIGIVVGAVSKVSATIYNRDAKDARIRGAFDNILAEYSRAQAGVPMLPVGMINAYNTWNTYARWTVFMSYVEVVGLGVNASTLIAGARLANQSLGWIGFTGLVCLGGYTMFDYLTRDYDTKLRKLQMELHAYYTALTAVTYPPTF